MSRPTPEDPNEMDRHGICGDPVGEPQYELFGEIPDMNEVESGSVLDVEVVITAHHKGHVELRLCEVAPWNSASCPATDLPSFVDQTCLNEHLLLRTSDPSAISGTERYGDTYWATYNVGDADNDPIDACGTTTPLGDTDDETKHYDPCWPERYYLGNRRATPSNPYGRGWLAHFKVQLPTGVSCDHCLLQMVYLTSNSCTPPGYRPAIDFFTDQSNTGRCGSDLSLYPEEFWNCADLKIYPAGESASIVVGTAEESVCTETVYGQYNTPTCDDGVLNQDEEDVDCGGTICDACPDGDPCESFVCGGYTDKDICNPLDCCAWTGGNGPNGRCIKV